eukprot:s2822_g11.t3
MFVSLYGRRCTFQRQPEGLQVRVSQIRAVRGSPARPVGRSVLRNLDIPVALAAPTVTGLPVLRSRASHVLSQDLAAPTVTGLPVLRSRGSGRGSPFDAVGFVDLGNAVTACDCVRSRLAPMPSMLHIQVLAEYDLQLCACSKGDTCVPMYRVEATGSPVCFTQVNVTAVCNESYAPNHGHLNELHYNVSELSRMRPQQVKQRFTKRLLDRGRLKNPENGVKYFKTFLRPLFVKGAANVFLYRLQQFMNLHRGNGNMLRWITKFQLSVQRMQEAWNDTYLPITDPTNAEAMERAKNRLRDQHARTILITANLVALIFVSLSDLTQDQRQVLTSLMAHRNRVLADYRLNELREVYPARPRLPLLYLDNHEGYWVEDEEDGTEAFLEADEDAFWVYYEEHYTWFQRRFQGRKMRRGVKGGRRKGKGKGGKGSGGRRFFKRRKGKSNLADDQTDAWQADAQWQDRQWQDQSWDDWS